MTLSTLKIDKLVEVFIDSPACLINAAYSKIYQIYTYSKYFSLRISLTFQQFKHVLNKPVELLDLIVRQDLAEVKIRHEEQVFLPRR